MSLRDKAANDTGRQWEYSQEGDAVEGTITGLSTFEGDYDPCPMVTIDCTEIIEGGDEQEATTVRILCGKSVLKRKIEEASLAVGDKIAIVYKGEREKKNAKPNDKNPFYSDFGVAVERGSALRTAAASDGGNADW